MREPFTKSTSPRYQVVLNGVGRIALQATLHGGLKRLFVLTPLPEPAVFGLMLAGPGDAESGDLK